MLTKGNVKLGEIWNWSIPAVLTCVARTFLCSKKCYATRGCYKFQSTQDAHSWNLELAKSPHFVSAVVAFLWRAKARLVRIHASGDFFSTQYVRDWTAIVDQSPDTMFYGYTRSWRPTNETEEGLIEQLHELSMRPNVRLWLSCDAETGRPPRWRRSPWAYMSEGDLDMPAYPVDLIFRDKADTVMKKYNGSMVCPFEQGLPRGHLSCEKCGLCFREDRMLLSSFDEHAKHVRKTYLPQEPNVVPIAGMQV